MIKRQTGSAGKRILLLWGAVVSTSIVAVNRVHAETPPAGEMEDMRREIHQLRTQVQTLRAAIAEAAELDAQRLAVLNKALKAVPADAPLVADKPRAAAPLTATPSAPSVAMAPTPAPAQASHGNRRNADAPKRVVEAPAPTGLVRGKVAVPAGEPVAYVYVENVAAPPVKDQHRVIEQAGKKFVPNWAVVQRGTVISFPNRDNIYHNVFSLSSGNAFDLGLYSGGEAKSHAFNEPGEVEIYCNIHPDMVSSTLVVPNRLFAKVKPDGSFEIAGVPPGKRKVVAWAPGSRLSSNWVDLEAGGSAQVDFKLESKSAGHKNKAGFARRFRRWRWDGFLSRPDC